MYFLRPFLFLEGETLLVIKLKNILKIISR